MTNNVDEIIDLTDELNLILNEYNGGDAYIDVVDLDAWATCDLGAMAEIFTAAIQIRIEENESITAH